MRGIERAIRRKGFLRLAGVDEAGRGALAGPVVAAAVILRDGRRIVGVTDSKRLSPRRRERLYGQIREEVLAVGVGVVNVSTIEARNILQATLLAMERAVVDLQVSPDGVIVDGLAVPNVDVPVFPVVRGDLECPSVAAASIVAKVTRDRIMADYHARYPAYGFDRHKGYGTDAHLQAIAEHGLSPIHRRTFSPVRQIRLPLVPAERSVC
ncbi:MAG: ribonuclease HII [candidate division NC10 bacterium]|nr:ribonuclease HII [candidate division NC10 bacterium]